MSNRVTHPFGAHGVHPAKYLDQIGAPTIGPDRWAETETELPKCNATAGRCEIWVPSAAFSLPTENEKRLAAKQHGMARGEEGWHYVKEEVAQTPGWIVVRRKQVMRMPEK